MKILSAKKAEELLKTKKATLHWNTVSATFTLRITIPYIERLKMKMDSTYKVQYKTGNKLDTKFGSKHI